MSISVQDQKVLFAKSGNVCAFPGCTEKLTTPTSVSDEDLNISNVAHIVSKKGRGPRTDYPLPMEQRDLEANLICMCAKHHTEIDTEWHYYTVERLRQMKLDHERMTDEAITRAAEERTSAFTPVLTNETVYASLLPVSRMPTHIYTTPTGLSEAEAKKRIIYHNGNPEMCPFVVHDTKLICFQNLFVKDGPFKDIVQRGVKRHRFNEWMSDEEKRRLCMQLLNRTLNKITGRIGLRLAKKPCRYFFAADEPDQLREVEYRPLTKTKEVRKVVWQPTTRITGLPKSYWYNRALSLAFEQMSENSWCLSICPTFCVTKNGQEFFPPEEIGKRVTRKLSRLHNFVMLSEVHFWREYLCQQSPRLILSFGRQSIIIENRLLEASIGWPGLPEGRAKQYKNVAYEEDLFSLADWDRAQSLDDAEIDGSEEDMADEPEESWGNQDGKECDQ
jgi:hypothetical protein